MAALATAESECHARYLRSARIQRTLDVAFLSLEALRRPRAPNCSTSLALDFQVEPLHSPLLAPPPASTGATAAPLVRSRDAEKWPTGVRGVARSHGGKCGGARADCARIERSRERADLLGHDGHRRKKRRTLDEHYD